MPTGWHGSTRRSRLPPGWSSTIAPAIIRRDSGTCQLRYPDICTGTATEVDHRHRGDDHHPSNLQAACGPCHRHKTGGEGAAARPRNRRPREQHPGLLP